MKAIFKLAWRNIWRNKRRTYITAASIVLAVLLASVLRSFQKGTWDNMVDSVVNSFFGYMQIHQEGYSEEQTLDKAFRPDGQVQKIAAQISQVKAVVPRLESFALASMAQNTQGVLILGVDPKLENAMTKVKEKVSFGEYLDEKDQAVLVGEGVAENLKLGIGDTIVLISQGYHGVNAAGKYPIKGTLRFGSPELNKQVIYMPLALAQTFFGAEGFVTTLALQINNKQEVPNTIQALKSQLDPNQYEVLDWEAMIPDLVQARELDEGSSRLILNILYLIIGFGIFGTILMMAKEREREFGVLTAIGMPRGKLSTVVWLETFLLGLLGSSIGILISLPIVYYMHQNPIRLSGEMAVAYEKFGVEPIMATVFELHIFLSQAFTIFILTSILALYPIYKIRSMKAVEMMRR